jgi:hypothetical protein
MSLEHFQKYKFDILKSIANATQSSFRSTNKNEPQIVANLIFYLTKEIKNLAAKHSIPIRCGGVFVHAQPQVKFQDGNNKFQTTEIGDLLLINTHIRSDRSVSRVAKLFQAKMFSERKFSFSNEHQHYLYSFWPQFEYIRSGRLNGLTRKITGPNLYNGTQYLFLPKDNKHMHRLHHWCHLHCHEIFPLCFDEPCCLISMPYENEVCIHSCFVRDLYNFIFQNSGRSFVLKPENSINWDQVITDLVEETAERTSRFIKNAGDETGERGQEIFLIGSLDEFTTLNFTDSKDFDNRNYNNSDVPPEINNNEVFDEFGGGLSIIEITIDESNR